MSCSIVFEILQPEPHLALCFSLPALHSVFCVINNNFQCNYTTKCIINEQNTRHLHTILPTLSEFEVIFRDIFRFHYFGVHSDSSYKENCIHDNTKSKLELLLLLFILQNIVHTPPHTHTQIHVCLQAWLHVYAPSLPIVSPGIFLYQLNGEVSRQRANFSECDQSCRSQHINGVRIIYMSFFF